MIFSVKLFSREDLHLEEQVKALNKKKDLTYSTASYTFLSTFILRSLNIGSFCLALYLTMSVDSMKIETGKLLVSFKRFKKIFRRSHWIFSSLFSTSRNL